MRLLVVSALVALLLPAGATAGVTGTLTANGVTMTVRDVPLPGGRALAAAAGPPSRFNLVGLHWQGAGTVLFRTRLIHGGWSPWQSGDADVSPDRGTAERRATAGWQVGNLVWTRASNRIQFSTRGVVTRLRAYYLWSPPRPIASRRLSVAGSPAIIPRSAWGADESIVRAKPVLAPRVEFAIVHHTAGSNDYTPAQAPAIVRGIEVYHVKGNGWNDIGYNALVDKYGQIYEGRAGGLTANVVGAHSLGFNDGSFGVSVIGNYQTAAVPAAVRDALVRLLAWRLDVAHVDPLSMVSYVSGGNPRYPADIPVSLRAISGHRDTYFTECPGNRLYAELPGIAQAAAALGLPKLYAPVVTGKLGGPVRFTATLSSAHAWTVTIVGPDGRTVTTGSGTGSAVDWTWDSRLASGKYTWTIAAGQATLPATGTIGKAVTTQPAPTPTPVPPPVSIAGLAVAPAVISPNGDGYDDATKLTYSLTAPAAVTAAVVNAAGQPVATLFTSSQPVGRQSFEWGADNVPDGSYQVVITATGLDGTATSAAVPLVVDRTLAGLAVSAKTFSPNGDGRLDVQAIAFTLATVAQVDVQVLSAGQPVASVFSGQLQPGPQQIAWGGSDAAGSRLADGDYQVAVTVTDPLATTTQAVAFSIDTTRPQLRIVSLAGMRFWVSEPSTIVLLVNGRRVLKVEPAGNFHVPFTGTLRTVRAVAWDGAGNPSLAALGRLVA